MRNEEGFSLIELLIVVAIISIIAAIAVPSLIRARVSANESQAIGDSRAVVSALATYASANCGLYPENLNCTTWDADGDISACIPGYPTSAPPFLSGSLAGHGNEYTKGGYVRFFEAFSPVTRSIPTQCDPNGLTAYCYDSYPSSFFLTGVRSFVAVTGGGIYEDSNDGNRIGCTAAGKPNSGFPIS